MKSIVPCGSGTWGILALSVLLSGACGGRAIIDDNAPGSPGGTTASAGAANVGGASANSGGSSAGASTVDAGSPCGQVECPAIACASSATMVLEPGACCPTCRSNCAQQECPAVMCASGYQPMTAAGQCCPTCVPVPTMDECVMGQQSYQQTRAQLAKKYQGPCVSGSDCVVVAPGNSCEADCAHVAILAKALGDLMSNLEHAAVLDCASCGPILITGCTPPASVSCIQGLCQIGASN